MKKSAPPLQTPHQRLRSLAAVEAIKRGKITIPLTCGWCQSKGVERIREDDQDVLKCLSCSRLTSMRTAHTMRKQKLRAIILEGIDLPRGAERN